VTIFATLAHRLRQDWLLCIKDGSQRYISADKEDFVQDEAWERMDCLTPLGHFVHYKCSVMPAFIQTRRLMWRAYCAKFASQKLRDVTVEKRVETLERYITPLLTFRCAGWPYQPTVAKAVDKLQVKMIGHLLYVAPWPCEQVTEYFRRRGKMAAAIAQAYGRWSTLWARRFTNWHEHCMRNHANKSWLPALFAYNDQNWLQEQRRPHTPAFGISERQFTLFAGRTDTRATRGAPAPRWESTLSAAEADAKIYDAQRLKRKKIRHNEPNYLTKEHPVIIDLEACRRMLGISNDRLLVS
jgi:hypothetical protein